MNYSSPSLAPKHYLFMLPEMITLEEQNEVAQAAKALLAEGYVYLISPHEKTVEDRDDIRYMPLRRGSLPCFGEVSGVLVARDQSLAQAAKQVYQAPVMVFEPGQPFESVSGGTTATERAEVKTTAWRPKYNTVTELRQAA
jgi:hypothetical protein